jgi:hypothetical protein
MLYPYVQFESIEASHTGKGQFYHPLRNTGK